MSNLIEGYWESVSTMRPAEDEPDLWDILERVSDHELTVDEAYDQLTEDTSSYIELNGKPAVMLGIIADQSQTNEVRRDMLGKELNITFTAKDKK